MPCVTTPWSSPRRAYKQHFNKYPNCCIMNVVHSMCGHTRAGGACLCPSRATSARRTSLSLSRRCSCSTQMARSSSSTTPTHLSLAQTCASWLRVSFFRVIPSWEVLGFPGTTPRAGVLIAPTWCDTVCWAASLVCVLREDLPCYVCPSLLHSSRIRVMSFLLALAM